MKIRDSFITAAAVLNAVFLTIKAEDMSGSVQEDNVQDSIYNDMAVPLRGEDDCLPVHETLKGLGATEFSKTLLARGVDFKYGQFTIFAPSDKLLNDDMLVLKAAGHSDKTINDVVLFHVSAEQIEDDIKTPSHCGKYLLMLNEDLHENQESSKTKCDGEKYFQIGPGNTRSTLPEIATNAIPVCNGVIYTIDDALMVPTLPMSTKGPAVSPTVAPDEPTMESADEPVVSPTPKSAAPTAPNAPTTQTPTKAPSRQTPPTKVPSPSPIGANNTPPTPTLTVPPPSTMPPSAPEDSGASKLLSSSESIVFAVSAVFLLSFF